MSHVATVTDCKVCIGSEFAVQCHHCGFEECQLTCGTCMDSGGNVSQPAPLTVPAGGCLIQTTGATMECRPDSERTCGEDPASRLCNCRAICQLVFAIRVVQEHIYRVSNYKCLGIWLNPIASCLCTSSTTNSQPTTAHCAFSLGCVDVDMKYSGWNRG